MRCRVVLPPRQVRRNFPAAGRPLAKEGCLPVESRVSVVVAEWAESAERSELSERAG